MSQSIWVISESLQVEYCVMKIWVPIVLNNSSPKAIQRRTSTWPQVHPPTPTPHTHLFLFLDDDGELCVRYAGVEFAAHERSSLVVFNVAHVPGFGDLNVFRKSLKQKKVKGH